MNAAAMRDDLPRWPVLLGLFVSLLIHGAVAVALAWTPVGNDGDASAPPPRLPSDDRIRPGIEASDAATINWIGYAEYERHLARQSVIDQAAMARGPTPSPTPNSGASGQEGAAPVPAPPPSQPASARRPTETQVREAASTLAAAAQEIATIADAARTTLRERLARAAEALRAEAESQADAAPQEPARETPPAEPAVGPPAEQPSPAEEPDPGAPGGGRKEAAPTSQEKPIEVNPGKPLAAEGLDIETVAPQFSRLTEITARPRDALARLHFDRSGRVRDVDLIQSTGYGEVDDPLLDSLYRWRAKGKRLKELPPAGRGSTVALVFRIRLR